MSCFTVSDKQLNDTLNFINKHTEKDSCINKALTYERCNCSPFVDSGTWKGEALQAFGDIIRSYNLESYYTRYPDQAKSNDEFFFKFNNHKVISIAQFLKNVDCLDYQCCETSDYKTSPNSVYLDFLKLRSFAINLIDGYDQAEWSY